MNLLRFAVTVEPVLCDHSSGMTVFMGMYTWVEYDFRTCYKYKRPSVLRDRFCWTEEVVSQDRFYCIAN